MSGTPGGAAVGDNGADANAPRIQIVGQYIKDLSFENPGAPSGMTSRPNIELGVDLQARRMEGALFEVELKLRVNAKSADERKELRNRADLRIDALGSGSDYSVFLDHLGIASLDVSYQGEDD